MKTFILFCHLVVGTTVGFAFPNIGLSRAVGIEPAVGFFVGGQPSRFTPRIVGGNEATPYSYPHQISLQYFYKGYWYHICGGCIVGEDKIVSAAHCIAGGSESDYRVVAGDHNLTVVEGFEQVSGVSKLTRHPQYNDTTFDNDYSVLHLVSPFTFNDKVKAIQMVNEEPTSGDCVNTGWGDTSGNGTEGASTLQEVTLSLLYRSDCEKIYGSIVTEHMICAGNAGKGACSGDSGGPLVCGEQLAGIVSWGVFPCGNYPTVYSNVAAGRSFIDEN